MFKGKANIGLCLQFILKSSCVLLLILACTQKQKPSRERSSAGAAQGGGLSDLPPEQVEHYKNLSLGELAYIVEDSAANVVNSKGSTQEYKYLIKELCKIAKRRTESCQLAAPLISREEDQIVCQQEGVSSKRVFKENKIAAKLSSVADKGPFELSINFKFKARFTPDASNYVPLEFSVPDNSIVPPIYKIFSVQLTKVDGTDFSASYGSLNLKIAETTYLLTLSKTQEELKVWKELKVSSQDLLNKFAEKFKNDVNCKVDSAELNAILKKAKNLSAREQAKSSDQIIKSLNTANLKNYADIERKREELIGKIIVSDAEYYPLQIEVKNLESQYANLRYFVFADTAIGRCAYKEVKTVHVQLTGSFETTTYLKRVSACPLQQSVEKGDANVFKFFLGEHEIGERKIGGSDNSFNIGGTSMSITLSDVRPIYLSEFSSFRIQRLGSDLKTFPAARNDNTCNTLDVIPFGAGRWAGEKLGGKDCGKKFNCTENKVVTIRKITLIADDKIFFEKSYPNPGFSLSGRRKTMRANAYPRPKDTLNFSDDTIKSNPKWIHLMNNEACD